jgi:hypothetical protein
MAMGRLRWTSAAGSSLRADVVADRLRQRHRLGAIALGKSAEYGLHFPGVITTTGIQFTPIGMILSLPVAGAVRPNSVRSARLSK